MPLFFYCYARIDNLGLLEYNFIKMTAFCRAVGKRKRGKMSYEKLMSQIDALTEKYIGIFEDVCNIESPTSSKAGVDAVGKYIIDYAKKFGWSVVVHEENISGDAICIKMNEGSDAAPICFSGHMDTVHPIGSFGVPAVHIEDESVPFCERKIFGPGVLDCKGGVVAALMAMEALHNIGYKKRPVYLILQSDEEGGSLYSDKRTVEFMAQMAKGCVGFLNTEGHAGSIVVERKGIVTYTFEITGLAVHSSLCFTGVNAVAEAAHKILELERFKDRNGITCNCGMISGGTTVNTVPDKCTFKVNVRYLNDDDLRTVEKEIERIASTSYIEGSSCKVTKSGYRTNMPLSDKNVKLYERVNEIFEEAGLPRIKSARGNGGSDAADMSQHGIPAIDSFGTEGAWIHSPKEYAYIASLPRAAKRLAVVAFGI